MGKRIVQQRRGRAKSRYKSPRHRFKGPAAHKKMSPETYEGVVQTLLHSPAHSAPLAEVFFKDQGSELVLAHDGMYVGKTIVVGSQAPMKEGNTLRLDQIPEGTLIHNIESQPGDGGKFVRASGTSARIIARGENSVTVVMPSKKKKEFIPQCRATIGVVAGGGRLEKPLIKAGKSWHAKKARGKLFPVTSKVAMNANNHPFGCGRGRHIGKPKTPSRFAPPGRKVGLVGARRTGRKNR